MRDSDWASGSAEKDETVLIRRVRSIRRLRIDSVDTIRFDVAGFKLDRELGIPEQVAVENNLEIFKRWPDLLSE